MRLTTWRCALALCMAMVLVLSLMPPSSSIPTTGWDKSNHMLAFAVLALLSHWAWPGRTARALIALLAFGGLIEVLQSFTPDRYADFADLVADGIGLAAGEVIARIAVLCRPEWRASGRHASSARDPG
ncbi:VanZ family protein [Variovorax ginsengisoli]|uniref:VanZ family protein n=1 Tax=Variovorax ginsengisoli TaxID=363844 RepID=A0ABT9S2T9_9BURK|nr:VanZ family protein [Variovorax ginsengisoli]MDP9898673.1 VanZ family protein [Variovorax ginsengisoli]